MIRSFAGAFLFFAGFAFFNFMNGSNIAMFINFHGMFTAFIFIGAGFLASDWTLADIAAVFRNKEMDEKQALRSIEMLSFFEKISVASAITGIIICSVIILSLIGDLSHIGKPLAVGLLMPFYCLIFYLLVSVLKAKMTRRAITQRLISK